jgi:hypothetical protein
MGESHDLDIFSTLSTRQTLYNYVRTFSLYLWMNLDYVAVAQSQSFHVIRSLDQALWAM